MMAIDDSISYDTEKIKEISGVMDTARTTLERLNGEIKTNLDSISNNWEGDIKETAEIDFQKAREAIDGINNNLMTISTIMSTKAEDFGKVRYE